MYFQFIHIRLKTEVATIGCNCYAFIQHGTVPERAVRKTRPPVPLANFLSCMMRFVSAICVIKNKAANF